MIIPSFQLDSLERKRERKREDRKKMGVERCWLLW
jgi:hypothetical protein